jgi:acyl-CoA synthetase (NDP forming)
MKVVSSDIQHKAEAGLIILNLEGAEVAAEASTY